MQILTKLVVSRSKGFQPHWIILLAGLAGEVLRIVGYRGLYDVCRILGRCAGDSHCIIQLGPDSLLRVDLSDPYWLQYLTRSRAYEPEIMKVITLFAHADIVVVDGGANIVTGV